MEINPISNIDYLLPPLTTTEETDSCSGETLQLEYMALFLEYQKCMKKHEYLEAAETATRLIDLMKENPSFCDPSSNFFHLYAMRANSYIKARNYDAALDDLHWIANHASLSTEYENQNAVGLIHLLQGKGAEVLKGPAGRSDPLALMLLKEPENQNLPNTEWLLLSQEERIQKYLEERHYSLAIEEIDQMGSYAPISSFCDSSLDEKWLAIRGACYALRGNLLQAIQDLTRANDGCHYSKHSNELALAYAMAGQRERALKTLKDSSMENLSDALMGQWIDKICPAPQKPACSPEMIAAAKEKLAQLLRALNPQMDIEKLKFAGAFYHVWTNSALGYPVPGKFYAQVLTPGFAIQFKYENMTFSVHTNEKGTHFALPLQVEFS